MVISFCSAQIAHLSLFGLFLGLQSRKCILLESWGNGIYHFIVSLLLGIIVILYLLYNIYKKLFDIFCSFGELVYTIFSFIAKTKLLLCISLMDFIFFLINHIRNFIEIYLGKLDTPVKYDNLESFL